VTVAGSCSTFTMEEIEPEGKRGRTVFTGHSQSRGETQRTSCTNAVSDVTVAFTDASHSAPLQGRPSSLPRYGPCRPTLFGRRHPWSGGTVSTGYNEGCRYRRGFPVKEEDCGPDRRSEQIYSPDP